MSLPKCSSRHATLAATFLASLLALAAGCEKDNECEGIAECYPVPTELPPATCMGANTMGAMVDSIMFVASYAPNTTSWGRDGWPDGIFAEWDEDGETIKVDAETGIRPSDVDARSMNMSLWLRGDSIVYMRFGYSGDRRKYIHEIRTAEAVPLRSTHTLTYDAEQQRLCGTFEADLIITYFNLPIEERNGDTLRIRGGRLDIPIRRW